MDVLADASVAASEHDSEAAEILKMMCASRSSPEMASDDVDGPYDPDSTDGSLLPRAWTRDEDDQLRRLALARIHPTAASRMQRGRSAPPQLEMRAWREIAQHFDERTPLQCAHRFQKVLNPENIKGMRHCHLSEPLHHCKIALARSVMRESDPAACFHKRVCRTMPLPRARIAPRTMSRPASPPFGNGGCCNRHKHTCLHGQSAR